MKEADIRPKDLFQEYLRLSALDAEAFFPEGERAASACPGCGADESGKAFEKHGFGYRTCTACGTLFVSPRPAVSAFNGFYADSPSARYWSEVFFPAVMEARREKIFRPRVEKVLDLLEERNAKAVRVVDVGAGLGLFLDEWKARRAEADLGAVEPSGLMAETLRGRGYAVLEGFVENLDSLDADGHWREAADLVTSFEVIEHVHDTLGYLSAIAGLVKPGGWVLITSLCLDGFDLQVLGRASDSISPPHHINFMTLQGFRALFERAGLGQIELITPGKLDVDIVAGKAADQPDVLDGQDFVKTLLARPEPVRQAFQSFLADNGLSSHAWVLARKPL
ncbi:MAG: class I SAM-dependent methyltransferase [Magnetovibrionaceae bacterium]